MAKAPVKRKAANGYKFAEPLPKGEILEDVGKKRWKLGPSIGKGGFGEIYSAQEGSSSGSKYPYVLKIEPHANGPLFVEMHFYMRNAKSDDIQNFQQEKQLKSLGMPMYYGSGSHEFKGEKYRFLVMEKFGTDLWKLFLDNNKVFPTDTVFKLGIQILDVLEYIHSRGYVHADIKAANILLGATKATQNKQIYLVDFGLAAKYAVEKEFKPNPKKAHDGTIEYLSIDAHQGVQTRRGDLEILAYNLIQWLGCTLPWEKKLTDPKIVQQSKEEHMESVPKMLKACFGSKTVPSAITDFLKYLKTLKFNTEPDYDKIRNIFISGVKEAGGSLDKPLQFSTTKRNSIKRKSSSGAVSLQTNKRERKNKNEEVSENDDVKSDSEEEVKKNGRPKKDIKKPTKKTKKPTEKVNSDNEEKNQDEDEKVTKRPIRRNKNPVTKENKEKILANGTKERKEKVRKAEEPVEENEDVEDQLKGFTEAMREVMLKKMQKESSKTKQPRKKVPPAEESDNHSMEGYTESMKELALKKRARLPPKRQRLRPQADLVPVPTTSKASARRGLVRNKLGKLKENLNHVDVVDCSDSE